jgi:hypothetical protein
VTTENVLFYGDNLDVLRRYIKDETVDAFLTERCILH